MLGICNPRTSQRYLSCRLQRGNIGSGLVGRPVQRANLGCMLGDVFRSGLEALLFRQLLRRSPNDDKEPIALMQYAVTTCSLQN